MGYKAYNFVGGKGPVMLPDDIDVDIRIIENSRFNSHQRFTGQTFTTWHDTGNPKTNAEAEYRWAAAGRPGGSVGGYSFIFDDGIIIQTQQLDRVTWAQGTATGNRLSWAAEQAFGGGVDYNRSLEVGAALHGGLCAMMGWPVDTHLVKHQYWYGKWCPGQILNRGIWSQVVAMTSDAALAAAGAAAGGQVPPRPVYAKPAPIPELEAYTGKPDSEIPYRVNGDGWVALAVFDRVRAAKQTPRYRYASGGDDRVGPDINAGEEFDVDWLLISTDFPDTYYSPWATRIRAGDCDRVSDVTQAA